MRKGLIRVINRKFAKKFIAASLIPLLIFTGGSLWFMFHPKSAKAVWFDDNWAFRKPISFTHNAAVYNTQVELDIDTTDSPDKFQADCGDVRFTDINGNLLRYFLDSAAGACDTASTDFDVLIPQIVNGTNVIYMYYGNPSASNGGEPSDFKEGTTTPSGGAPSAGTEEKGPSPTLYWKFDEGGGTIAEDQTSNNLDGTLNNTPTRQTEDLCISGKCLYFTGADNENVSISDPSSGSLDFTFTDNFSVQAWVKRNGASSANTVIINKASDNLGATYQGYKLYMDASGDFCFATRDGTLAEDSACTSAVDFDDDKWHHVAGTKLGRSVIRLYVDGNERASDTSIDSTGSLANSGNFYTGVDSDGTSNEWLGFIDEVKVYRDETVRSPTQIAADFNARSNNEGVSVRYGPQLNNNPQALNNGLVGYWKEDETTNGAAATDSSGNSTSLTDSGTVVRTAGKFGNGGDFESGSSQYQSIGDNAVLSITGSLTLAAWIRPESVSAGTYNIIAKWDGSNESYRLYQSADELVLEIESNNTLTTVAANLAASTWYHVGATYDSASSTGKIYLNSSEQSTTTAGTIPSSIGDDGGAFHIGAEDANNTPKNFYDGIIDEARVYNRSLSSAEISQLYNFAPGPSGEWKLDEKSGTTANDTSGNGKTSTITAGAGGWTSGKIGSAYNFDGVDTKIDTSSTFLVPQVLTVEGWIYPKSEGESGAGTIWSSGGTGAIVFQMASSGTNGLNFRYGNCITSGRVLQASADNTITLNTWQHVAVTFSGSTDGSGVTFYVNGVVVAKAADESDCVGGLPSTTDNWTIGAAENQTVVFDGLIDQVRVFDYVRTPGQIVEGMNAGHPAPGSPVGSAVAYWKMDEGYGTTANDSHPTNDNDLTLSSASWTNSGKFGKAWNGTGALWLSRADDADFDFAAADDFSISMWVKSDDAVNDSNNRYLIDKESASAGYAIYFEANTGIPIFGIDDDTISFPEDSASAGSDFYDATWHHIVAIKTGTSRIDIYIDGILRGSDASLSATGSLANADSLIVGDSDGVDGLDEFPGDIDEVKIFRLALTADQVKQEFNRGSAQVLGALSDNSSYQPNAANQEYCVPGDSSTCSAPVGEWKLEEKNGATANDTSGTGNNGTILGAKWTNGKIGSALQFDGIDDNINFGSGTAIDDLGPMSFSFWMYPNTATFGHLINKRDGNCSGAWRLAIETSSNDMQFIKFGGGPSRTTSTNVFTNNAWNHIAVTWDGTINQTGIKIYANGREVSYAGGADGSTIVSDGGCNLFLASRGDNTDFFNGRMDEVEVFNYVRTSAQIAWDYNRGGPVGYWKFDECQGTTLNDASLTNSYNGNWSGSSGSNTSAGNCTTVDTATAWYNGRIGKMNYSLDFDGTDDQVLISDTANLRFDAATEDFSLFAWVKRTTTGTEYIISKEDADNDGWRMQFNSSNQVLCSEDATDVTSSSTVTDTNWHFAGCTIDRDGNGQVYIDGRADGSAVSMGSDAMATTSNVLIGTRSYTSTSYLNGQIDNVRIYNYALTANQVKILMNQGGALRYGPTLGAP